MKSMVAFTLSLFLVSCMGVGMMGTHGRMDSGSHQMALESALEKEVEFGDVKAIALFPPLQVGEKAVFTLKLVDKTTGQPVSNAKVSFHTSFLHAPEERHMSAMYGEGDSTRVLLSPEHDMNFDQEVEESAQPGVYVVSFTPSQASEHKTMFHIGALGERRLRPEVIIETTRHAAASGDGHGSMLMDRRGGMSDYLIIGGIVMGAVMIVIWAARGGSMF